MSWAGHLELTRAQAARLTRLAGWRRGDGHRGVVARWALRTLIRAGDQGDRAAVDAVLEVWLRDPEDGLWASLTRWRELPRLVEAVIEATVAPGRSAGSRAAVGVFCARHGLAPGDPVRHALFLVLTGQPEQHRALDPDGSLLAAAYQAAGRAAQAELRQALAGTGDLDVVRVLVGFDRPDRTAEMRGEEIDDLAREHARRDEWEQLWRLVRAVPLDRAVAAMPLFPGWRPADGGRQLFAQLAAAQPDAFAATIAALQRAALTRIPVPAPVMSVSFAPDLSQIVIAVLASPHDGSPHTPYDRPLDIWEPAATATVGVHALPGGRLVRHDTSPRFTTTFVLHTGDVVLAAEIDRNQDRQKQSHRLVRMPAGPGGPRSTVVWHSRSEWDLVWDLTRHRDGFVAVGGLNHGLIHGRPSDTELRHVSLHGLGLRGPWAWPCTLAADAAGERLAIGTSGRHDLSILDGDFRVVARNEDINADLVNRVVFSGPDRLVTAARDGWVRLWRRDGADLAVETQRRMPHGQRAHSSALAVTAVRDLVALPATGQVAVITPDGTVTCMDGQTLEPAAAPAAVAGGRVASLWGTPGGERLAVARTDGYVEVHDLRLSAAAGLLPRPVSTMTVGDLLLVKAEEPRARDPEVREVLRLLRACLEDRFGAEVALGRTRPAGGDHDIAL